MTEENKNIDEQKLREDIAKTLEDLKKLNADIEEKIRQTDMLLNSLPNPDNEPDTDDQEAIDMESDYADKVDKELETLSDKLGLQEE